jgi:hypothetical protein
LKVHLRRLDLNSSKQALKYCFHDAWKLMKKTVKFMNYSSDETLNSVQQLIEDEREPEEAPSINLGTILYTIFVLSVFIGIAVMVMLNNREYISEYVSQFLKLYFPSLLPIFYKIRIPL